mmetsp:Transcript_16455/g.33488  ORF Transcript_16455/g.33488 Transcript_16455/m.33488 type:complete len:247 (-) Transcript_16455:432-1172(-)
MAQNCLLGNEPLNLQQPFLLLLTNILKCLWISTQLLLHPLRCSPQSRKIVIQPPQRSRNSPNNTGRRGRLCAQRCVHHLLSLCTPGRKKPRYSLCDLRSDNGDGILRLTVLRRFHRPHLKDVRRERDRSGESGCTHGDGGVLEVVAPCVPLRGGEALGPSHVVVHQRGIGVGDDQIEQLDQMITYLKRKGGVIFRVSQTAGRNWVSPHCVGIGEVGGIGRDEVDGFDAFPLGNSAFLIEVENERDK